MILRPFVPTLNNVNHAVYTYLTVERAVLGELSEVLTSWARENLGPQWFSELKQNPSIAESGNWKAAGDPLYLLKCLASETCPLREAVGNPPDIGNWAKEIKRLRNNWAHSSVVTPVVPEIRKQVAKLYDFAVLCGLSVSKLVEESKHALESLTAPGVGAKPPIGVAALQGPKEQVAGSTGVPRRPRIGSAWDTNLPPERYLINEKLRDIKSERDGTSLKKMWGSAEAADGGLSRIFALGPSPAVVYVDPRDGATVGFIEGSPYFFGYAGVEPELEPGDFRGIFLEDVYEFTGSDLVRWSSQDVAFESWPERAAVVDALILDNVAAGTAIQVTNYGDLVTIEDDGARGVATIPSRYLN